jgi:RNA polymerase sigma-54 factor
MALTQRLEFRQSQALVMTPQLMQAIKLLQLSNLDLAAYVEGELERNPLLERSAEAPDGAVIELDPPDRPPEAENLESEWGAESPAAEVGIEARNEIEPEPDDAERQAPEIPSDQFGYSDLIRGGGHADSDYNLEAFVSAERTLADHLSQQLTLAVTDPIQRMIGQYLIDSVDEAGYLTADLLSVAEKLGAPVGEIEKVLALLQQFDPVGVCACNLKECLGIQLKELDRYDPAMQALLERLDLVARRDFQTLRRICGVGDEDLIEMIAEVRHLNPKPGLAFGSTLVQPVVPDVFVRPAADGSFAVELNSETLPKVLVNQTYYAKVSKAVKANEKSYLSECMQSATWLVRALDQRARTILKVASEIVRQQDAFFAQGVQHLRPLNLKTVADATSVHESTVSRVTANKYMATARGIFELKYFFTAAIPASDGGESHSAEAVRHRIKQLIESESAKDVLSDDTIVDRLRGSGIDIARRTVAKYRDAMHIPSSVQRRREKSSVLRAAS